MKKFVSATAVAAVAASSTLVVSPAQAAVSNSSFTSYTANGMTSQYHVIANGIDWSQPVGVVFYLDGDYHSIANSKVGNPSNSTLLAMAAEANERNMVFVPVISPDTSGAITWHEDRDANGVWFRAFATDFIASIGADSRNIWTIGHSGGSEFITFELNSDPNQAWRTGGGSIMIGGGGSAGVSAQAAAARANDPMYWYVGAQDDDAATAQENWSALVAAAQGASLYKAAGFTKTKVTVVPNTHHHNYDFPGILAKSIDDADIQLELYTGGKWLAENGKIQLKWQELGGEAVLGLPVHDEVERGEGALAYFANERGEETGIYWSAETGAHAMNSKGAIYFQYLRGGYMNEFGFPTTDEYTDVDGVTRVHFSKGQTINWTEEKGVWVTR